MLFWAIVKYTFLFVPDPFLDVVGCGHAAGTKAEDPANKPEADAAATRAEVPANALATDEVGAGREIISGGIRNPTYIV